MSVTSAPTLELKVLNNPPRPARIALIGQPNCGKSTLFNSVAGYRSEASNFCGSTVQVTSSRVRLNGTVIELIDVPGIYSLTAHSPAERAAKQFLLESEIDLIINVVDASLLSRCLEFTLELRELGMPMMLCLNMADEAERKGMTISAEDLEAMLGIPVVTTVASRGAGVTDLFDRARLYLKKKPAPVDSLTWSRDVERAIAEVTRELEGARELRLPTRWVATKLIEGDDDISTLVPPAAVRAALEARNSLVDARGRASETVIMSERHDLAMRICEATTQIGTPKSDIRVAVDRLLTHPIWGYVFLAAVLTAFFWTVFGVGSALEGWMNDSLERVWGMLGSGLTEGTFTYTVLHSLWGGFVGGAAIVLPFLLPFLVGLAILEDAGYLPRVAFLADGLLHRIGLHGTSVVPLMLGYGCSIPACMATRILPSRRDRFIASVLSILVPCSARSIVIFALIAAYLGPLYALGIFLFNGLVVIASGYVMSRIMPEVSPGLVLDVPRYQWPSPKSIARKVWFRMREFVTLSWPILIVGSLVLGLAEFWHLERFINEGLSPLTVTLLGLPVATGTTLVFGVMRKELSMVMLVQAMGTQDLNTVMTAAQLVTFTVFVTFYLPCLATIATLVKEIGKKLTFYAAAYTVVLATALGIAARLLMQAFAR